jgi:cytochrome c553
LTVPASLLVALLSPTAVAHSDSELEQRVQFCKGCHRAGYTVSYVPTLEAQPREYLFNQLKAFKEKHRPSDGHQRYWGPLSEKDMLDVAAHFAARGPVRESFDVDARKVAAGQAKAESLQCASCHQPSYRGKEDVPRLAGLHPQYAAGQIRAFIAGSRQHPRIDGKRGISQDDAEALGQYFAQVQ